MTQAENSAERLYAQTAFVILQDPMGQWVASADRELLAPHIVTARETTLPEMVAAMAYADLKIRSTIYAMDKLEIDQNWERAVAEQQRVDAEQDEENE